MIITKLNKLTAPPTDADIKRTHLAIAPMIHRTPVMRNVTIDRLSGAEVYFKCENFQKVGAFKMRGASSAALRLSEEERRQGLCTHSSGNHAQAVARAAHFLGVPAFIVMPENAPAIKQAATRGYGAKIIFSGPTIEAREAMLEEVVRETGATFIHPYNDYNVIAGQATAVKELIEDTNEPLDVIMAPIGGGGLMSGTALYTRHHLPEALVIGAEPERVDDAYRSFHSGRIEGNASIDTIADGLRTTLGPKTFDIIRQNVHDIVTVREEAIIEAMRLVWERMKIIIEPSCAVPLAALLKEKERFAGKRVGIILSGGNVDLGKLPF